MPIPRNEMNSMPGALQQIFYKLKYYDKAVATLDLIVKNFDFYKISYY